MYGGINLIAKRHQVYTETMHTFMTTRKLANNQIVRMQALAGKDKYHRIVLMAVLVHQHQVQDLEHSPVHKDLLSHQAYLDFLRHSRHNLVHPDLVQRSQMYLDLRDHNHQARLDSALQWDQL